MDQPTEAYQNKQRFEAILQAANPDLYRVYLCIDTIAKFGGNGRIEIHLVDGHIARDKGIYMQPGFKDNLVVTGVFIKKSYQVKQYDGV